MHTEPAPSGADHVITKRFAKGNKIPQARTQPITPEKTAEVVTTPQSRKAAFGASSRLRRVRSDLQARLAEVAPSIEGKARVQRCVGMLETVIQQLPGNESRPWRIGLFGSVANGFGMEGSDLDVTCYQENKLEEDEDVPQQQPAGAVLRDSLAPLLTTETTGAFALAKGLFDARVPILKLYFEEGLEVDISCHNTKPLQNTRLLQAYAGLDSRVRDLGILVKLWARAAQIDPEVQLPRLPIQAFQDGGKGEADERAKVAKDSWLCHLPLEELLLRFFRFYASAFAWGAEIVAPRFGERHSKDRPVFAQLRNRWQARLHVEDPCEPERNLNCVLGEAEEVQLHAAFVDAWCLMQKKKTPVGLHPAGAYFASAHGSHPLPNEDQSANLYWPNDTEKARSGSTESSATTVSTVSSSGLSKDGDYESFLSDASSSPMFRHEEAHGSGSEASNEHEYLLEAFVSGQQGVIQVAPELPQAQEKKWHQCGDLEAALAGGQQVEQPKWWHQLLTPSDQPVGQSVVQSNAPRVHTKCMECHELEAVMAKSSNLGKTAPGQSGGTQSSSLGQKEEAQSTRRRQGRMGRSGPRMST